MATPRQVTSTHNPLIRQLVILRDSKKRRLQNLVLIDGDRNIARALQSGWEIECYVTAKPELRAEESNEHFKTIYPYLKHGVDYVELSEDLLRKVAYGQSMHSVAIAQPKEKSLDEVAVFLQAPVATVLVLDQIEKPGNLGAVIRTCDALGVDALLLSDPICDLWNPNAVRSSTGAIFTMPIGQGSQAEIRSFLAKYNFEMFGARLEQSMDYLQVAFPKRTAVVFGNEADGLRERWAIENTPIRIEMRGAGDCLNVSISAGIIAAEIIRQTRQ